MTTGVRTAGSPPPGGREEDPPPPAGGRREFAFEKRHFEFVVALIRQLAGIALAPHKMEMVYSRLARRLRDLKLPDFDSYCALLESDRAEAEIGFLVNALTTNLTSFFREPHHFDHLRDKTLPEVQQRQAGSGRPRLRIWSAGCSSGQEPYTIAMVVASAIPDLRRWDARILATDIDTHMVETARRGVYPADMAQALVDNHVRDRFFHRQRGAGGDPVLLIDDEVKRLITFKPLNLLEPWPMRGPFDAIFCRNVLIYFDRIGRKQVIDNFARLLSHDGYLYLGHSESLYGVSSGFRQIGPTIYRRE